MILETATMEIVPGREDEFVAALEEARTILAKAPGWRGLHVHRGIERPSTFLLNIAWDSVEHHTQGFRESDLFVQWRALIGPYFASPPQVEHWSFV